jgi:hypothetical protein
LALIGFSLVMRRYTQITTMLSGKAIFKQKKLKNYIKHHLLLFEDCGFQFLPVHYSPIPKIRSCQIACEASPELVATQLGIATESEICEQEKSVEQKGKRIICVKTS